LSTSRGTITQGKVYRPERAYSGKHNLITDRLLSQEVFCAAADCNSASTELTEKNKITLPVVLCH
jgi:hypothetical protein